MNFPSVRDGKRNGKTSFSKREIEFIGFRYGQCKGFKEIADDMGCGERTVRYYSREVLRKLGMNREVGEAHPKSYAMKALKLLVQRKIVEI